MGNHEKRIAGREMIGSVWQSIMVMSDEMHNAFPFRKCTYQFFLQKKDKNRRWRWWMQNKHRGGKSYIKNFYSYVEPCKEVKPISILRYRKNVHHF